VLAIINDSNNYGVVINVPFKKIHFVKPVAVYLLARWNISAKVKQFVPAVDATLQSIF
jgi:hypothetical protein